MKILIDGHMLGSNEGGNERYIKNMIVSLARLCPNLGVLLYLRGIIPPGKYKCHIIINNDFIRLLFLPFIMFLGGYSLLHATYITPFIKFPHTKYIVTVHDLYFMRSPHSYSIKDRLIFYILFPYCLWISDAIILPTNFIKEEFSLYFPQFINKVHITKYGVSDEFKDLGLYRKENNFLCISSKSNRKNIGNIIDIFSLPNMKNHHLNIVGHIPKSLLNYNRNIRFLGYVSDTRLNKLYNCSEALIYLSSYEGFGFPILEALACNTPVIASNITCMKEVGKNYINYVEPNNITSFIKLINTSNLIKKNISQTIRRLYNWNRTAKNTLHIYENI